MLSSKLLATQTSESKLYVDDVFSTYLYTGNGSTQTINNGIDLAGKGGMVWVKSRASISSNYIIDTVRGGDKYLVSNNTGLQNTITPSMTFQSTGYTDPGFFLSGTQVGWTFRKAPKFFDVVTYTGDGTANRVISHSLGQEVGMIQTKSTSVAGDWNTYHRSSTGDLKLNLTDAQTASKTIVPSATASTFTVNGVANTNGVTYVAYLYAHDTEEDGMIQCGSFTHTSGVDTQVDLGWEPQFLLDKRASAVSSWRMYDMMRGFGVQSAPLYANLSNAEEGSNSIYQSTSTGFIVNSLQSTGTYIYMAIRRPNKPPESGSEVFAIDKRTGDAGGTTYLSTGFDVDMAIAGRTDLFSSYLGARLTGSGQALRPALTNAEDTTPCFDFDVSRGIEVIGNGTNGNDPYINWFFRRAPGFFDVVCYTGTGVARTVPHSLGVVPELMIVKNRSQADAWAVYAGDNTDYLVLNTTAATADLNTYWNDTSPTASVFTVGTIHNVNASAENYVAYLFSTLAGISKVGSYTGNGTSQTINCGFSTGARLILIKRTDSTGDWYLWDTTRGIVAGNDPHLSLNTTAAEVTTDDSVDPDSTGFIVNQVAATNINVNAASYIFLTIA